MKAKVLLAGMFVVLGATTKLAQYARDVMTEGQATINEERKLGQDAITHQIGNARHTTQIPWRATRIPYQHPCTECAGAGILKHRSKTRKRLVAGDNRDCALSVF